MIENQLISDFIYVGEFIDKEDSVNLISFKKEESIDNKTMSDKRGRVYIFLEEDEESSKILKIGKSSDKGGIKGTLNLYYAALSGTPGPNRFYLHHLISEKLKEGKRVKVFVRFAESVKKVIYGLTSNMEIDIPLDVTYIEKLCVEDYLKKFGSYPIWNYQERGERVKAELQEKFANFIFNKSQNKNNKNNEDTYKICGGEDEGNKTHSPIFE